MVIKISVGKSLYGALAYNGEKDQRGEERLLTTNRIYNDGTGTGGHTQGDGGLSCLYAGAYEGGETGTPYLSQPASRRRADRHGIADITCASIWRKLGYGNSRTLLSTRGHRPATICIS